MQAANILPKNPLIVSILGVMPSEIKKLTIGSIKFFGACFGSNCIIVTIARYSNS